jgi:hypothetical protein
MILGDESRARDYSIHFRNFGRPLYARLCHGVRAGHEICGVQHAGRLRAVEREINPNRLSKRRMGRLAADAQPKTCQPYNLTGLILRQ